MILKLPASLVKNIEVLQNSNILRYNDNQSSVNGTVEVTEMYRLSVIVM